MITEFALAATMVYGYNYLKDDKRKIKKIIKGIFEDSDLEYTVLKVKNSEYGYNLTIGLNALGYEGLEKLIGRIETSTGSLISIKQNDNLRTATVDIITVKLTDDYKFKPVKVKPYELYLGKTYTMKDVIVSMKDLPHVLYSGINSSGKTYCVITALTNLIYWHSEREIELFLSQISAKKDLRKFKDCKQCRGYAANLQESYELFKYIYHVMLKRIDIFNSVKDKFIDDIYEFNTLYPGRKMRIIYVAMDEFTAYMPDSLDSSKDADIKQKCLDLLIKIIQQSRCAGIYILTSLQRADKESLPPRLKAQFNCRVSFKQSNIASSLVVCDSEKAFHLKPKREALVNADTEYLMKTLYLDNDMIAEFIKDKKDTSNKNYYNYKQLEVPKKNTVITSIVTNNDKETKNKIRIT